MMIQDVGIGMIERVALWLGALIRTWTKTVFGPVVQEELYGGVSWDDVAVFISFIAVAFVLHALAAAFLRRKISKNGMPLKSVGVALFGMHWRNHSTF